MIRSATPVVLTLALAITFTRGIHAQISVGPNVRVSSARPNTSHNEVLMAADPSDPNRLLACGIVGRTSLNANYSSTYGSFDGGKTWTPVKTDSSGFSGDPACEFGVNGRAYFASLSRALDEDPTLSVWWSQDGGRTWKPSLIPAGTRNIDREYIAVDRSAGKYHGRVYIYGQVPQPGLEGQYVPYALTLWRSLDGGATFERPVQLATGTEATAFHPGPSVVLSDGTFVALFAQLETKLRNDEYGGNPGPPSRANGRIKIITSTDGGESLTPAVVVSDLYADWRESGSTIPSFAADIHTSAFKDRLYAVWSDGRFGGRTQILLSYSTDRGKTWSAPKIVNDGRRRTSATFEQGAIMPAVAVNKDGIVGVSWYDRRENTTDPVGYHVRFAASLDGGETFTESARVSEKPRVFGKGEQWNAVGYVFPDTSAVRVRIMRADWLAGGHTAGIAATADGRFHPLWVDNRTGLNQMWTAAITVSGQVVPNGSPTLAELRDVSSKVRLTLETIAFDETSGQMTMEARVKNISKESISAPIVFRLTSMVSDLGEPSIINADNGIKGEGATWDFTSLISGGSLAPGQTTAPKRMLFRLANAHMPDPKGNANAMVEVGGKILARK
jgi:hypothetical protein